MTHESKIAQYLFAAPGKRTITPRQALNWFKCFCLSQTIGKINHKQSDFRIVNIRRNGHYGKYMAVKIWKHKEFCIYNEII